jgi:hypothetical protein
MQIVFWLPRVGAKAGPAVRSVRKYAQAGWRLRNRSGLVACAALVVALSSTYRTAEAQVKIVDVNFPVAPDALVEEIDSILNRETCLFEFRAEELTKQAQAALDELRANYRTLDDAHRAKNVSDRDYKRLGRAAGIRLGALESTISRISDFPRCLNFVGSPPGRSTPQVGSLEGSSATSSDRKLRTTNIRGVGTGLSFGLNFSGNFHMLGQTETSEATGAVTNDFSNSSEALGVGFNARFLFPVGNSGVLAGPNVSFDYLNQDTSHALGGGFFLQNTVKSITNVGITVGVNPTPQILFYTNFGASWIDRDQKLNFLGPTTTVDSSAPGATVGIGMQFRPPGWAVPIVLEVDQTFVQKTSVSNPGSPGFLYRNSSDVTTVKAGVVIPVDLTKDWLTFGIRGAYGIW